MNFSASVDHAIRVADDHQLQSLMAQMEAEGISAFDPCMLRAKMACFGIQRDDKKESGQAAAQSTSRVFVQSSTSHRRTEANKSALEPATLFSKVHPASTLVQHSFADIDPIEDAAIPSAWQLSAVGAAPWMQTSEGSSSPPSPLPMNKTASALNPHDNTSVLYEALSPRALDVRCTQLQAAESTQRRDIRSQQRGLLSEIILAAISDMQQRSHDRIQRELRGTMEKEEKSRQDLQQEENAARDVLHRSFSFFVGGSAAKAQNELLLDEGRWRRYMLKEESSAMKAIMLQFIRGADSIRVDGHRLRALEMEAARLGRPPTGLDDSCHVQ